MNTGAYTSPAIRMRKITLVGQEMNMTISPRAITQRPLYLHNTLLCTINPQTTTYFPDEECRALCKHSRVDSSPIQRRQIPELTPRIDAAGKPRIKTLGMTSPGTRTKPNTKRRSQPNHAKMSTLVCISHLRSDSFHLFYQNPHQHIKTASQTASAYKTAA